MSFHLIQNPQEGTDTQIQWPGKKHKREISKTKDHEEKEKRPGQETQETNMWIIEALEEKKK